MEIVLVVVDGLIGGVPPPVAGLPPPKNPGVKRFVGIFIGPNRFANLFPPSGPTLPVPINLLGSNTILEVFGNKFGFFAFVVCSMDILQG